VLPKVNSDPPISINKVIGISLLKKNAFINLKKGKIQQLLSCKNDIMMVLNVALTDIISNLLPPCYILIELILKGDEKYRYTISASYFSIY
jgi:hypothetical protein